MNSNEIQRYSQLDRFIAILELLASHRFGLTIDRIHEEMQHRYSVVHRTIVRDVMFMQERGLVTCDDYGRSGRNVYKFDQNGKLAQIFLKTNSCSRTQVGSNKANSTPLAESGLNNMLLDCRRLDEFPYSLESYHSSDNE